MDQWPVIDYYPYILGFGVTFGMSIITNIVIICFSDNNYDKLEDSTINYDNTDIDIVVDDENVITENNQIEDKGEVDNGKIELTMQWRMINLTPKTIYSQNNLSIIGISMISRVYQIKMSK